MVLSSNVISSFVKVLVPQNMIKVVLKSDNELSELKRRYQTN